MSRGHREEKGQAHRGCRARLPSTRATCDRVSQTLQAPCSPCWARVSGRVRLNQRVSGGYTSVALPIGRGRALMQSEQGPTCMKHLSSGTTGRAADPLPYGGPGGTAGRVVPPSRRPRTAVARGFSSSPRACSSVRPEITSSSRLGHLRLLGLRHGHGRRDLSVASAQR